MKRTRILSNVLIPNEKEETYYLLINMLKQKYGFNPVLFTMDFQKSSAKAIKKVFPRIYLIKCFFHFIQCMHKHIIKLKLNKNENKNEILEIFFNIKLLSFVKPENIPLIYKKIKKKYDNKKFADFFNYFEKNWNPNCRYRKMKIIPPWNYYNLINYI